MTRLYIDCRGDSKNITSFRLQNIHSCCKFRQYENIQSNNKQYFQKKHKFWLKNVFFGNQHLQCLNNCDIKNVE